MTSLREALTRLVADLPADTLFPVRVDHLREILAGLEPAAESRLVDRTCAQAGQLLGRKPSTIRAWCELGQLPGAYKLRGREWRIPAAAIAGLSPSRPQAALESPSPPSLDLSGWRKDPAS